MSGVSEADFHHLGTPHAALREEEGSAGPGACLSELRGHYAFHAIACKLEIRERRGSVEAAGAVRDPASPTSSHLPTDYALCARGRVPPQKTGPTSSSSRRCSRPRPRARNRPCSSR